MAYSPDMLCFLKKSSGARKTTLQYECKVNNYIEELGNGARSEWDQT